jgi:hypothetical protein
VAPGRLDRVQAGGVRRQPLEREPLVDGQPPGGAPAAGHLANYAPGDVLDLEIEARRSLEDTRARQNRMRPFFQAARLKARPKLHSFLNEQ